MGYDTVLAADKEREIAPIKSWNSWEKRGKFSALPKVVDCLTFCAVS